MIKFYDAAGVLQPERRPGAVYKMAIVEGQPAHRELSPGELTRRQREEDVFAAWKAFELANSPRKFTRTEYKAFRVAFIAGQPYVPGPRVPTETERLAALEAAVFQTSSSPERVR